jgi:TPP-dependent pyruvate/acetoin dehydrogenase alpha subunit
MSAAALWQLPVIFACVNNVYGMGMKYDDTCRTPIAEKGAALKIPSMTVDGNDVQAVYRAMTDVVRTVKSAGTPALVEMQTYRVAGHSVNDHHVYRAQEEVDEWKRLDPIERLQAELRGRGVSEPEIESIDQKVGRAVAAAEKFALESPYPQWDESAAR